jgi:pyruvate dehydrogenase E1 component alpha subunit
VIDVYNAAVRAVERARSGGGPTLIETRTYRYYGHYIGDDPHKYRLVEEEEAARTRDCIDRLRKEILEAKVIEKAELDAIDAKAVESVDAAVTAAEADPWPEAFELTTDVYTGE